MNDTSASDRGAAPTSAAPPPSAPPPPGTPPSRPPLRRDPANGFLGGVAAGFAKHLGVDVVVVRVVFVVLTILTQGLGAVAYLFGWIFLPEPEDGSGTPVGSPAATQQRRGAGFWVGVGLLTLGAIWFLGAAGAGVGFGVFDAGIVIPLLLLGLGVALWHRGERRAATSSNGGAPRGVAPGSPPEPGPPPEPGESPSASASTYVSPSAPPPTPTSPEHVETTSMSTVDIAPPSSAPPPSGPPSAGPPTGPPPMGPGAAPGGGQPPGPPSDTDDTGASGWTPPPAPPKERSMLTRLTLGLMLVAVGVLWILEMADVIALGLLPIAAIALGIVGLGLLVGSVVGRGRILILVGMLLLPVVVAGGLLRGFPTTQFVEAVAASGGTVGEISERPTSIEVLQDRYQLGAGTFELDLSDVELTPGDDVTTNVEMGAGELVVTVPRDAEVFVEARVAAGEVRVFGQRRSGLGANLAGHLASEAAMDDDSDIPAGDTPVFRLEVNVGFGDVTVRRANP